MHFTDDHFAEFNQQGFTILHNALPEDKRTAIAQGLRSCLSPWDQLKAEPPEKRSLLQGFPFPSLALNQFFVEPGLVAFAQRILGSEKIHYAPGFSIVRYPGEKLGSRQGWHIDNGNNSLLPESEDWRYGQVVVWYFPEPVKAGQGALQLIPKPHQSDQNQAVPLVGPGNFVAVFHNYLWHSGSDFTADWGQRYSHGGMYALADHYWEGLSHFTHQGQNSDFRQLVSTLTPTERVLFRLPPVGHPYYTKRTLALLEEQYPGWDRTGEYAKGVGANIQSAGMEGMNTETL